MNRLNTKDPAVQFLLAELEELEKQRRHLLIQCQRIRKKLDAMRRRGTRTLIPSKGRDLAH